MKTIWIVSILVMLSACSSQNQETLKAFHNAINSNKMETIPVFLHPEFVHYSPFMCGDPVVNCKIGLDEYLFRLKYAAERGHFIEIEELSETGDTLVVISSITDNTSEYLRIDYPSLKEKIVFYDGGIKEIIADTIMGYSKQNYMNHRAYGRFIEWVKINHPEGADLGAPGNANLEKEMLKEYYMQNE